MGKHSVGASRTSMDSVFVQRIKQSRELTVNSFMSLPELLMDLALVPSVLRFMSSDYLHMLQQVYLILVKLSLNTA